MLALVALSVAPLLMVITRNVSLPAVMAVALAGYVITVLVLAMVCAALGTVLWLSGEHVGYGILAATVGSSVGQMWAVKRLRTLTFGSHGCESVGEVPRRARRGSPASPTEPSH
jgi:hypothetical protein